MAVLILLLCELLGPVCHWALSNTKRFEALGVVLLFVFWLGPVVGLSFRWFTVGIGAWWLFAIPVVYWLIGTVSEWKIIPGKSR